MQKENKHNFTVAYLYIEDFFYKNDNDYHALNGHPHEKKVYRAYKYPNGSYDLYIGAENTLNNAEALKLRSLKSDNVVFTCNIKEVDHNLIMELSLDNNDIKIIDEWEQTQNIDLIAKKLERDNLYTKNYKIDEITHSDTSKPIEEILRQVEQDYAESVKADDNKIEFDVSTSINKIIDRDYEMFSSVERLLHHISSTYDDKYEASDVPNIASLLCNGNNGKHINTWNAVKYIQRYLTTGFNKSEDDSDLYKAIHYILIELSRKK